MGKFASSPSNQPCKTFVVVQGFVLSSKRVYSPHRFDINLSGWAGHQKLRGIIGGSPVAVFSWIRFTGVIICESGRPGLYKQHCRRELLCRHLWDKHVAGLTEWQCHFWKMHLKTIPMYRKEPPVLYVFSRF